MNRKKRIPSAARVLRIERALTTSSREWLNRQPRPERLFGRRVPRDLDGLTFGELLSLQDAAEGTSADSVVTLARIILKSRLPAGWILRERADKVFGFVGFVAKELERIGKLFKSVEHAPDDDEVAAGINDLDFGAFGLLDWYARRMGITNHDDAMSVPWLRVYQCMKMDADRDAYERRLRDIVTAKYKPKKR